MVIGLGSMGRRRIRLIQQNFEGWIICGVDTNESRRIKAEEELNIATYDDIDSAILENKFKCALVCTSPLSHNKIIEKCLRSKISVFTEINLVKDGYDENVQLAKDNNLLLFLSSSMIYRDEMRYLKNRISSDKDYFYTYHVGQYLPDWHPWESYKDFFIGKKETNGCREILAIELPWIQYVFGEIESISSLNTRVTKLDIDFSDVFMLLIKHKNGRIGSFVVDVAAYEPVRDLKIIGEKHLIKWEGTPETLYEKSEFDNKMLNVKLYDKVVHESGYNATIVENEYINELRQFFAELNHQSTKVYDFKDDKIILSLIDEVESYA